MIEEEKRWYAPDPLENWSRTIDSLPINDSVWLRLYECNLRTVADVADAYAQQPKAKPYLTAAFWLANQNEKFPPDSHRRQEALNRVWGRWEKAKLQPLETWPFDTRTVNALKANKICTVGELVYYFPNELLKGRGIGCRRLFECRQMVAFYNLCFGLR